MKNLGKILIAGLIVVVISVTAVWMVFRPSDPLFRGKPESEWIKNLSYSDDEQVEQWRKFGPEGVHVLIRALEGANRPLDRGYRKTYRGMARFLPDGMMRLLPAPRMDVTRATRKKVVSLLSSLGKDAPMAVPAMAEALKDEAPGVREIAINFFTDTEDENALLNQLPQQEKRALLPDFIRAIEHDGSNWGLRNNAAIALRYYPEEREVVAPVLVKALDDPVSRVRLLAAEALYHVAPDAIATEGVVPIVIGVLRDPDDQIAYRAAYLLGEMGKDPSLAVPALIEGAQRTNTLVAGSALRALASFPDQAEIIVPALEKAMDHPSGSIRRSAANSLEKIGPAAETRGK